MAGLPACGGRKASARSLSLSLATSGAPYRGPREFLSGEVGLWDERAVHEEQDQSQVEVGGFHRVGAFEGVDLEAVVRGLRVEDADRWDETPHLDAACVS